MSNTESITVSELFLSTQGEGLHIGTPSVFMRTFGCNFRCKQFGITDQVITDKYNPEVKALIDSGKLDSISEFKDLPLLSTGCDTYASIYPEFKKFMTKYTIDELAKQLLELTPNKSWITDDGQPIHLIITGGEPLLGWQRHYQKLFDHPLLRELKYVTFETNVTQSLHKEFREYLKKNTNLVITWSCSPKLSISGECRESAILPNIAFEYITIPNSNFYFKFVVNDPNIIPEIKSTISSYQSAGIKCPIYLMPVGGCYDEYHANSKIVAEIALQNGWKYSPRLHIDLFGNAWNT